MCTISATVIDLGERNELVLDKSIIEKIIIIIVFGPAPGVLNPC